MMYQAVHYILSFLLQVASFLFLARFILQACRVEFYNPVSQGVVKITDPVLRPVRLLLPTYRNLDFAALAVALVCQIALLMAVSALEGGYTGGIVRMLVGGLLQVAMLAIQIFWFAIMISILASWIAPGNYHPALQLLHQITEPLLAPARRLLPPMGGLDLSPIIVFLVLGLLQRMLPQIVMSLFTMTN
jgi:YggT family protein